jgi:hypothetical protein
MPPWQNEIFVQCGLFDRVLGSGRFGTLPLRILGFLEVSEVELGYTDDEVGCVSTLP